MEDEKKDKTAVPCVIFEERVLSFFADLSDKIFRDAQAKQYPELISYGFWCRKASLLQMKRKYDKEELRLGRGLVFHITPANVPLNFAYSLAAGLLSGNANIVRLPSKKWEQAELLLQMIEQVLQQKEHQWLIPYLRFVRYEKESQMTQEYSKRCAVRVIWGGDETISRIRESAIPAKSYEIPFADRYSFCLIHADAYLQATDREKEQLAAGFYNDTYLSDQNACTSPHLILWQGSEENCEAAKVIFWQMLDEIVKEKYTLHDVNAVDKWVTLFKAAAYGSPVQLVQGNDNLIVRVHLSRLEQGFETFHCGCGYFYEYHLKSWDEIFSVIDRKYQTMAYFGIDVDQFLQEMFHWGAEGVDRIVPIGKTMDFSLVWDGYDLIRFLSREIAIS